MKNRKADPIEKAFEMAMNHPISSKEIAANKEVFKNTKCFGDLDIATLQLTLMLLVHSKKTIRAW